MPVDRSLSKCAAHTFPRHFHTRCRSGAPGGTNASVPKMKDHTIPHISFQKTTSFSSFICPMSKQQTLRATSLVGSGMKHQSTHYSLQLATCPQRFFCVVSYYSQSPATSSDQSIAEPHQLHPRSFTSASSARVCSSCSDCGRDGSPLPCQPPTPWPIGSVQQKVG